MNILNDFDECKTAIINPDYNSSKIENFPKIGVTCFSKKIIDKFVEVNNPEIIGYLKNTNGHVPIYKFNYKGVDVAIYMSPVGAPACTNFYEEILAKGLEKLVMFGTCGVLDKDIKDLAIIIPTSAIRDEGTSYHYAKSSDEISVNEKYVSEFVETLNEHHYSYIKGKTWTTDAPYRETKAKMEKRKEQGCVCVDMECSAMSAVSKFRNKDFFQFFYAADNLDNAKWDSRSLGNEILLDEKSKIILLALEFAIKL